LIKLTLELSGLDAPPFGSLLEVAVLGLSQAEQTKICAAADGAKTSRGTNFNFEGRRPGNRGRP